MMIPFCKMHGLGNDFVVINALDQTVDLNPSTIKHLAHRHLGIGFNQLLVLTPSTQADFACRIFNADGSEAEQCGNGLRCVARFIFDNSLTSKKTFSIATKGGIFPAFLHDNHLIKILMGVPCFEPAKIPFVSDAIKKTYPLKINGQQHNVELAVLSMGNPHAILQVNAVKTFPLAEIGQQIAEHPAFPQSVNVGFMEIIDRQHILLRTFERGSGETLACGSNACAAVVAGIINDKLDYSVTVSLTLGDLWIEWAAKTEPVSMIGPAVYVFEGTFTLPSSPNKLESVS